MPLPEGTRYVMRSSLSFEAPGFYLPHGWGWCPCGEAYELKKADEIAAQLGMCPKCSQEMRERLEEREEECNPVEK